MSFKVPFATITSTVPLLIIATHSLPVFAFISDSISPSSFTAFERALSASAASLTAAESDELSFMTLLRISAASSWAELLLSFAEAK